MEFVGEQLLFIHLFLSFPLLLPPLWNLFCLFTKESHTQRLRSLAVTAPAYYTLLSASLFSGFVIWAMLGFVMDFKILAMLALWLVCFALEILRHKRQKLIKVEADISKREAFFRWAKFKYSLDLSFFAILLLWAI
ncbi:MAG: hypothetical protein K2N75_04825 [Helicobacter sp.]|uniref:hypothetical protein n=1 Tax=Helicobacter sp. TaxID=218 RepID=UPI0023D159CE|nr:hypothetical protein [Helicobacter sp.]MDE5925949.1 hypothetical protein [Helicobacter sp.]MDE7175349.1 hypothetical protein [Helicobacter sp.]